MKYLSYNYYSSYLVFRSMERPSRYEIPMRLYEIGPD